MSDQTEQQWSPPVGQAPAPPAPPTSKSNAKWWVGGIFVVLTAVGLGSFIAFHGTTDPINDVEVLYEISLYDTDCGHEFEEFDGYSDITQGTEIEVFDGRGNLLGFGAVGPCDSFAGMAVYTSTFTVDRSEDGKYRVTAGNDNRGFLNYTEDDFVDGTLEVYATLGE